MFLSLSLKFFSWFSLHSMSTICATFETYLICQDVSIYGINKYMKHGKYAYLLNK